MSLKAMYSSQSKFLKPEDLLDPETKKFRKLDLVIKGWDKVTMPAKDDKPPKEQVVLTFRNLAAALDSDDPEVGKKQMGLNNPNMMILASLFDLDVESPDIDGELDKLIGGKIRVYRGINPPKGSYAGGPTLKISEEIFEMPKRGAAVSSDDDEDEAPAPPKKSPVKAKLKADDSDIPF